MQFIDGHIIGKLWWLVCIIHSLVGEAGQCSSVAVYWYPYVYTMVWRCAGLPVCVLPLVCERPLSPLHSVLSVLCPRISGSVLLLPTQVPLLPHLCPHWHVPLLLLFTVAAARSSFATINPRAVRLPADCPANELPQDFMP